jgi:predicted alpha/beta-hydrolase family hydrolase
VIARRDRVDPGPGADLTPGAVRSFTPISGKTSHTPAVITIETPRGPARAHVEHPDDVRSPVALVLGHGAGGGVSAPDLRAAADAALALGMAVALVEQPYRVAGRRAPAPAAALDEAWTSALRTLRGDGRELAGIAIVAGGRSMGARVACRTAAVTGAIAVLCLAFPLQPPRRAGAARPAASRLPELDAVTVPVLVVQGTSDRFGMPPPGAQRTVTPVRGDHGLKSDLPAVRDLVGNWLAQLSAVAPGKR